MSVTPKRIWTTFSRNGEFAGENRELYRVEVNQYGDYLFTLDGGDVWQFTIRSKFDIIPTAENVMHLGVGKDSKTGKPGAIVHFLGVEGPEGNKFYTGNLRILPRQAGGQAEPEPNPSPNPKGRKPEYDRSEDARIFDLYKGQPELIPIETFREENPKIKQDYTLRELRRLVDRERKRRNAAIVEKRTKAKTRQ